jgi:hypothetical protein
MYNENKLLNYLGNLNHSIQKGRKRNGKKSVERKKSDNASYVSYILMVEECK